MILALRTDKPEAELYLYKGNTQVDSLTWQAHRELSDTLFVKIDALLAKNKCYKLDLTGIIVYQGPGSFTGLRISITVANTLSYSLGIPIAAMSGGSWDTRALHSLKNEPQQQIVIPKYGSEAHITQPRK